MKDINDTTMEIIYSIIFDKSMKAYDNIINTYPSFQEDMRNAPWIQKWKYNNSITNNVEMVAHAYTTMILTHLFI